MKNDNALPIGSQLMGGNYTVVQQLGSGGFGNTYLVRNRLDKVFAMKEFFMSTVNLRTNGVVTVSVPANKTAFESQRAKFEKEARRLSKIDNEHIVKVHDLFYENGTVYYTMDYIDGESLDKRKKPLKDEEVKSILVQVLDALSCVHSLKPSILHLDLKPANIMMDKQGNVYLIDFGSCKQFDDDGVLSTTTSFSYTQGYAPSEQMKGAKDELGPWTDFYALGATLYNLLTNKSPRDIDLDSGEKGFAFTSNVSPEMRQLIMWMMKPNKKERPQTVSIIEYFIDDFFQSTYNDEMLQSNRKKRPQSVSEITNSLESLNNTGYRETLGTYTADKQQTDDEEETQFSSKSNFTYYNDPIKQAEVYWSEKNYDAAFPLYKKAAEQGNPEACIKMGLMNYLCLSSFVKIDGDRLCSKKEAVKWFHRAAEKGHPESFMWLGMSYQKGNGVPKDDKKAMDYYTKSAEKGFVGGQYFLGRCYEEGLGTKKNLKKAIYWYEKAAKQGDKSAKKKLEELPTNPTFISSIQQLIKSNLRFTDVKVKDILVMLLKAFIMFICAWIVGGIIGVEILYHLVRPFNEEFWGGTFVCLALVCYALFMTREKTPRHPMWNQTFWDKYCIAYAVLVTSTSLISFTGADVLFFIPAEYTNADYPHYVWVVVFSLIGILFYISSLICFRHHKFFVRWVVVSLILLLSVVPVALLLRLQFWQKTEYGWTWGELYLYRDDSCLYRVDSWNWIKPEEQYVPYYRNGLWGIAKSGKRENLVGCYYDDVSKLDNIYWKVARNGVWGIIDTLGHEVVAPKYVHIEKGNNSFWKICDRIGEDEEPPLVWGLADLHGNEVVEPRYRDIYISDTLRYGYYKISDDNYYSNNELYGAISEDGKYVIPIEYSSISINEHERWVVRKQSGNGSVYGIINNKGEIVLPVEYDYIVLEKDGNSPFYKAQKGQNVFKINVKGQTSAIKKHREKKSVVSIG